MIAYKFRLYPKGAEAEKLEDAMDYNSAVNILTRGKELASMEKATNTEQFVQQVASMKSEAI